MKLFFDLFPVILFFAAYKFYDIYAATGVMMGACVLQNILYYLRKRTFEKMHVITLVAVVVLGGLTLLLRNDMFIKWKPSIVNFIFAAVFLLSPRFGGKPLVQRMMEKAVILPETMWIPLNIAWVIFFIFSGLANLAVAYTCSEPVWVNFKLFGLTGLSFLFIIGQMVVLKNHIQPVEQEEGKEEEKESGS